MTERRDSAGSPFLRTVGTILRFLIRLIFVVVIGALIGLGLFYGVPWAYRRLVAPVQENSARITILEGQVANNSENISDNNRALQERIVDLETGVAELQERTAAQAQDQEALTEEGQRLAQLIAVLEEDLETQNQTIEQVRSEVADATADLEGEIEGVQEQLEETEEDLGERIEMAQDGMGDLEGQLGTLEGELESAMARLSLLQTAQSVLKVRLLLVEENPGAARDTLTLAVAHLDRARELLPSQGEVLDDVRERMLAMDDLIAERSFRARPNLEALWADVMDLVTPLTAGSTVTGTETTSPLPTPTASP